MKIFTLSIIILFTSFYHATGQTPSPTPFKVDDFGQVKASNYDTWNDSNGIGGYRIGGQSVIKYDAFLTNFACGKVTNGRVFYGGQQNFICGNVVFMPWGTANTVFGWDAGTSMTTGSGNTFFGHDAGLGVRAGSYNTFIGQAAGVPSQAGVVQVNESIAIGAHAVATENNQLVIGGAVGKVNNAFIGSGVTNVSPQSVTIQATGGRGTNNRGADLTIAAGRSTGNAPPASMAFAISKTTVSGSAQQTLVKYWGITSTGSFKALTTDSKLEVNAILMKSPSGFCYELKITDTGLLLSSQIACP